MPREVSSQFVYPYPFDSVVGGRELRYPTHRLIPQVVSSSVVSSSSEGGVDVTTRLRVAALDLPEWVKRAVGIRQVSSNRNN